MKMLARTGWLFLIILFFPSILHASTIKPEISYTAPKYIACDQTPFVLSYRVDSYQFKQSDTLQIKVWSTVSSELVENWNPVSKAWQKVYSSMPWSALPARTEFGSVLVRISDCTNNSTTLQMRARLNGVNFIDPNPMNLDIWKGEINYPLFSPDEDVQSLNPTQVALNSEDKTLLWRAPFCSLDLCPVEDNIRAPIPIFANSPLNYRIDLLNDSNAPVATLLLAPDELGLENMLYVPSTYDCSSPTIDSVYEYTLIEPTYSQCALEITHNWWQNGQTFLDSELWAGASQTPMMLTFRQVFPFDFVQNTNFEFTPLALSKPLLNEVSPFEPEWVELYNSTNSELSYCGFSLDDGPNGGSPILLAEDCTIEPNRYKQVILPHSLFNNDGDTVQLLDNNKKILTEFIYPKDEGVSFVFDQNKWVATITPTPSSTNILTIRPPAPPPVTPVVVLAAQDQTTLNTNDNNEPIVISAIDVPKFVGSWVELTGNVKQPSGTTFWIEDSSGIAKIYIQAKWNIQKPKLFSGQKIKIIGKVDLYRGSYRILPEKTSDIIVLSEKPASTSASTTTAKKTAIKKTVASNATKLTTQVFDYSGDMLDLSSFQPIPIPAQVMGVATSKAQRLPVRLFFAILITVTLIIIWYDIIKQRLYPFRK